MRRQSLLMLGGAVVLALIAVFLARAAFAPHGPGPATTFAIVAAAKPLTFGEKITSDSLKLVALPVEAIPAGAFRTLDAAVGDGTRVAQRGIAVNEVVVPTSISGTGNRLSTMGVLEDSMRAMTVDVTESSGVGGLIAPGDRVDVYITRTPPEKTARYDVVGAPPAPAIQAKLPGGPHATAPLPVAAAAPTLVRSAREADKPTPVTDLLIQDVRVLAIGQNLNVSSEKPELVKSATLEVTPSQVAKLELGQRVGSLALALRPLSDTDHTVVASLHVEDLHDGPARAPVAEHPVVHHARAVHSAAAPAAPSVEVIRSGESTHYTVPVP